MKLKHIEIETTGDPTISTVNLKETVMKNKLNIKLRVNRKRKQHHHSLYRAEDSVKS